MTTAQTSWTHGGTMAIGAADSGKHSSKNILQFLVSKLEGEFFGNQEKQVEILRGFITSLTNHKRDVKPEEIDQVYTSLTNSLGRIPGIIEFVEGLEQAGFVTESQSIQAITGMPELSDAVKMEFGENVELSFRKELSSVTVEPESLMNVISTAFDADGAWFIQEGYISFIETYRVIPGFYAKKGDSTIVEIIVSDFSNEGLRDIVNYLSKKFSSVQLAVSPREEFDACLEKIRRPAESIIGDAYAEIGWGLGESEEFEDDSMVGLALDTIVAAWIDAGASDIHLIPHTEKDMIVQYRINGALKDGEKFPVSLMARFESKIIRDAETTDSSVPLSGIDLRISEKDKDINGKKYSFQLRINLTKVEFYGKTYTKIVMRVVDLKKTSSTTQRFADLGMDSRCEGIMSRVCTRPSGLILVVWPTGSGKTRTLYTSFGRMIANDPTKRYITFEDPVEAPLPGAMQHQIDDKKGYGFVRAVELAMREDPDVILVGEMRDPETASMCVDMSMTGHLTFSTLHTNDAVSTIGRMQRLGIQGADIAEQLAVIVSQRLEKRVCPHCRESGLVKGSELNEMLEQMGVGRKVRFRFSPEKMYSKSLGAGCQYCGWTGISGQIAIYEMFEPNIVYKELISSGISTFKLNEQIWKYNEKLDDDDSKRFVSMFEDGLIKVGQWIISFDWVKNWTSSLSL